MEEAQEVAQEVAQEDPLKQKMEEFIILEEDPEMYAMAGVELVSVPVSVSVPANIESTIKQAMASVPNMSGTTVNFKIVCNPVLNNCNNVTLLRYVYR